MITDPLIYYRRHMVQVLSKKHRNCSEPYNWAHVLVTIHSMAAHLPLSCGLQCNAGIITTYLIYADSITQNQENENDVKV